MGFLSRLFGSKRTVKIEAEDLTSQVGIGLMLRKHLTGLRAFAKKTSGGRGVQQLCDQLLTPARLSSTAALIEKHIQQSLSLRLNVSATQTDSNWFTAVTVSPWLMPDDVRANLPGGYPALLNAVTVHPNQTGLHLAHWIYCTDGKRAGAHLTLIPNTERVLASTVWAQDLLTPSERRQIGI